MAVSKGFRARTSALSFSRSSVSSLCSASRLCTLALLGSSMCFANVAATRSLRALSEFGVLVQAYFAAGMKCPVLQIELQCEENFSAASSLSLATWYLLARPYIWL